MIHAANDGAVAADSAEFIELWRNVINVNEGKTAAECEETGGQTIKMPRTTTATTAVCGGNTAATAHCFETTTTSTKHHHKLDVICLNSHPNKEANTCGSETNKNTGVQRSFRGRCPGLEKGQLSPKSLKKRVKKHVKLHVNKPI